MTEKQHAAFSLLKEAVAACVVADLHLAVRGTEGSDPNRLEMLDLDPPVIDTPEDYQNGDSLTAFLFGSGDYRLVQGSTRL